MEIQVSLVIFLILAHQPHEANKIVVSVLNIVQSGEKDEGENGSDLDKVGVGWLAVLDLEIFSSCFEEHGKLSRRHGVRSGLSAWL